MVARPALLKGSVLVSLALAATLLAGCTGSDASKTSDRQSHTGDTRLLGQIRSAFADHFDRAAVAVVADGNVRSAYIRADETTVFEVGTITKALTGELLAMAINRGEVSLHDPIGAYLDLDAAPTAFINLESLATHHGGIPPLPTDSDWIAAFDRAMAAGEDPPNDGLDEFLELARDLDVKADAAFENSNVGSALLGHALAAAADTNYSDLLTERILKPLGMDHAVLAETSAQVPDEHAGGYTESGEPVEAWSFGAFSPAVGLDATLTDLVVLAQAVIDGNLAGSAAQEPIADTDSGDWRIGYQWFVTHEPPGTITVIEGETAGFSSCLLINQEAGTAAIVLANSVGGDPYHLALRLLSAADR
jgi:CubicO group peptidase (beta-lactamase class C family)